MAIITISREIGSLGDEIAKAAADKLGYKLIEKTEISETLSRLGFSVSEIDKYDEKKPSVWQTLSKQRRIFAHLIRAAVFEIAVEENVVIVGRGGQVILKDIPGTIHVRIIAPYARRVVRLMELEDHKEKDAERVLRQSDRDSSGFMSMYFDVDWQDNDLYDLVINTREITVQTGVELIGCAAGDKATEGSSQEVTATLKDLALTQKAKAVFLDVVGLEGVNLAVERGAVSLSGLVRSSAVKANCEEAILKIEGITSVDNQLVVSQEQARIY